MDTGGATSWIAAKIKWIMLVSGPLTFTMIYAAIAVDSVMVLLYLVYFVAVRREAPARS